MSEAASRARSAVVGVLMTLVLTGLGVRLALLHMDSGERVTRTEKMRRYSRQLVARRGNIRDRMGGDNILAMNLAVKNVCADPREVVASKSVLQVASALAELLDMEPDTIAVRLNRPRSRFACVRRSVQVETVAEIQRRELPGLFFRDAIVRHYPQESFMCHVLGFVNHEGLGSAGVEQSLDRYLRGSPGEVEGSLDALRRELYERRGRHIPALEGADVTLTLDQNVQFIVEKALDRAMTEHNAKGAWAIVQHVKTGEILAMASRPDYDLNDFTRSSENERLNRCVGWTYEPGSVMKTAVIAAALNEGVVSPATVFDCENGSWYYAKRILRDYHAYDHLTVADGLKKSSNILTAKVALALGNQHLYDYLCRFGIGRRSGIDLPGEEHGILHAVPRWHPISPTRIAIGQGVSVTALQMLGVYSAIANDGILMRPYLVRQVTAPDGEVLLHRSPQVAERPISYETAALMRRLLNRVTEDGGTGRRARVDGYQVAGKTGTAEKAVAGGYSATAYTASFVGFLPATDPELAMIVVVDEPQPLHTGGRVAGPVFGEIASETVRYLDVPPDSYNVAAAGD